MKWKYPAYLPKPPHHMTPQDWQSYTASLTKQEKSERYSGITSDLIPTFEMIQAQGLGDVDPDPYKRGINSARGMGFPQSDGVNYQQYGLASDIIDVGRAGVDVARRGASKAGEVYVDVMGTDEDPSAVRIGIEWLTGTGPQTRRLGPASRFVKEFRKSAGLVEAREKLYRNHGGILEDGDSLLKHPVKFTFEAARNAHTAAEQFVGTYIVDLRVKDRRIHYEARNTTSLESLTFGRKRSEWGIFPGWPKKTEGPGGNKYQILWWSEPIEAPA